jgi:1-pyrroline-5-carboxylate dehydrogenase
VSHSDDRFNELLQLINDTSEYALTGAIFATDRAIVGKAINTLRNAAWNLYVNESPPERL